MIPRLVLALALGSAPFQCASDPDPARRLEDSPAEALYMLAERFEDEGRPDARRTTLQQLVERYPSSREAERARRELEGSEPATGARADVRGEEIPAGDE